MGSLKARFPKFGARLSTSLGRFCSLLQNMGPEGNQHVLPGPQNISIHGGTFATVAGNMTINTTELSGKQVIKPMRNIIQYANTLIHCSYRAKAAVG